MAAKLHVGMLSGVPFELQPIEFRPLCAGYIVIGFQVLKRCGQCVLKDVFVMILHYILV